jgi:hypothetical protein
VSNDFAGNLQISTSDLALAEAINVKLASEALVISAGLAKLKAKQTTWRVY